MAVDYATLKKGGFMRQKQKNHFSLRLAVVGGNLTSKNLQTIAQVAEKYAVATSPTLLFFKEGKEVERIRGLAKRPAIEKVIEKLFQSKENVKMLVTVAGEKKKFEQGTTIAKLIEIEKVENPEYVTVTVNDESLNRADFETTQVKENDTIEFLYFMGGGAF